MFKPSKYQKDVFEWVINESGKNLVVQACAGSGKTTTAVEMCKFVDDKSILMVAFNKHIEVELNNRLPNGAISKTYHALGLKILRDYFGNLQVKSNKIEKFLGGITSDTEKYAIHPAKKMIALLKANLREPTKETIRDTADFYDIDMVYRNWRGEYVNIEDQIYDLTVKGMEYSKNNTKIVDFDDMCWLPVKLELPSEQWDFIIVDELQDTNACQTSLALKVAHENSRIVGVGDTFQSIYGWRGANVTAMKDIANILKADELPLSITYRNPLRVVELVNNKFPEIPIECSNTAKVGHVEHIMNYQFIEFVKPGDMVLCRVNAPLASYVLQLLRRGIKAIIKGRDIGSSLTSLIVKMKADSVSDLFKKLQEYYEMEYQKFIYRNKPENIVLLTDKLETIHALSEGAGNIPEIITRINNIFSDEIDGITFSSIHKAKGLEARRVFILRPDLLPHPMAKMDWQKQAERNVEYVALTRTLDELYIVE